MRAWENLETWKSLGTVTYQYMPSTCTYISLSHVLPSESIIIKTLTLVYSTSIVTVIVELAP